jgi:hypothetical protein
VEQNNELLDQAVLGEQLESFWNSDVGNYLLAKAEREYIMAFNSWVDMDVSNVQAALKTQSDAKRAKSFRAWVNEGIIQGLKAKEILEDRDE